MLRLTNSDDQMTGKGTGTGGENGKGFVRGARPLFLVACLVALAVSVAAGPVYGQDVKLWPDGAPGAKGTDKNDTPTLKIFPPPKDAKGPAPAVLLIPGGGYKHISGYETFWAFFQTRPVQFFSMKYRLPTDGYRHPAPLQDAQRAVRTIRANAKKWNVDPDRVLVVAFSSGGHLATTLATHYDMGKFIYPSSNLSPNPNDGKIKRHHRYESVLKKPFGRQPMAASLLPEVTQTLT